MAFEQARQFLDAQQTEPAVQPGGRRIEPGAIVGNGQRQVGVVSYQ